MAAPDSARKISSSDDFGQWIKENGRTAAIAAGLVAAAAVGIWLYIASESRKEEFASQALMQARGEAESGNLPLAGTDLTRLIERFDGTKSADQAVILLNQTRLVQGQRDVAINALRQFVSGRHADYVKASAYALMGGALEDAGRSREAAEAFHQASQNARLDFLKAQYLIDAGRAFTAAKDTTAARTAYGEVLSKYGRLDQAAEARVRMAEIGGAVPPAPPADSST
ncbi:MAG: tol-pal system YbgF family protein, partial [Gemmatimonadales bacterium]